jgi:hypothetical protein
MTWSMLSRSLTLTVWWQVILSIAWFLLGLIIGAYADIGVERDGEEVRMPGMQTEAIWGIIWPFFWAIWVLCWQYTGYWAFSTGNKLWMMIYNLQNAFYSFMCFMHWMGMLNDASVSRSIQSALVLSFSANRLSVSQAVSGFNDMMAMYGGDDISLSVCCSGLISLLGCECIVRLGLSICDPEPPACRRVGLPTADYRRRPHDGLRNHLHAEGRGGTRAPCCESRRLATICYHGGVHTGSLDIHRECVVQGNFRAGDKPIEPTQPADPAP